MKIVLAAVLVIGSVFSAKAADWPPAEKYINIMVDCKDSDDAGNCEYTRAVWSKQYDAAIHGDYQGQRNVSFCLSMGCNEAIVENRILGCAWRHVIVMSGHLEVDATDTTNLKHFCGAELLDDAGRAAAEAQSKVILKLVSAR